MKGSTVPWRAVLALVIPVVLAGWYLFQGSSSEEYAAAAMKQEIAGLKSLRMNADSANRSEIVLKTDFETALRAELKGDEQFAGNDYAAAKKSYAEALSHFKKVLGESETLAPAQILSAEKDAAQDRPKQNAALPPASGTIYDEIENTSQKSLERRRELLAAVETQRMIDRSPPAVTPESSLPKEKATAGKNDGAATIAATAPAGNDLKPAIGQENIGRGKTSANPAEIVNSEPKAVNRAALDDKLEPAGTLNESISEPGHDALPEAQEQGEEPARRDIGNLIDAYRNSLASKNLTALKALFRENFIISHENAWSDFFAQATDVRVSVERKNYKIDASSREVDLVVTIQYSNRKGVKQEPLRYSERWILERLNGNWQVVARRFD